ncbi:unnamed protein product [Polarella glacialis]|uniref:Cation efflux protein transmembrane domain-containing protein n=1 Tax=Polarella glacialis TaxID=89957 RepID=A0A813F123_POLGL|nr:unnamed protein product [Polarella glacialis]
MISTPRSAMLRGFPSQLYAWFQLLHFSGERREAVQGAGVNCQLKGSLLLLGQISSILQSAAVLHNLVHPGCTGHGGTANGSDGRTAAKEKENLNVTSAMLHLVADVLRGVTILVVAILIEVGVITDPGKADAVCALLVAGFVAMGSVELLRRALTLMCRRNSIVEDISQPINPNQQYV